MGKQDNSRRDFLKTTVAASAAASIPYFSTNTTLARAKTRNLDDPIPIGLIGAGGMGVGNMHAAKKLVKVVAICDVDKNNREKANQDLSDGNASLHEDYREILDNDDIKIVHIATPDHWHTKPLVEAMLAGKDIYCEKPMTLTIDEGKLIRKVQKETGRIVQVGTQQRSTFDLFTKAIAMIQQGRLGKIKRIQCAIGGAPTSPEIPIAQPPAGLNWERWLGPTPKVDYREITPENSQTFSNGQFEFRWWYEFSGGKLTDWGAHHVDIACWALRANGQTGGPESISGKVTHPVEFKNGNPVQTDRYNTATAFNFTVKYPGGVEVVIRDDTRNGVLIEGDAGRIFVSRGSLKGKPVEDLASNPLPENAIQQAYKGLPMQFNERIAHWANFVHCHREQIEPISDVHSHMEMLNVCHLAGISARLGGRELKWDAVKEVITNDDLANSMLARPYRAGYEIELG